MQRGSVVPGRVRPHPLIAVALRYEPGQGEAPRVVASGRGYQAGRILEIAEESGVPIHKETQLAELLQDVPVPNVIPEELFEAVARVIAFVWRVDSQVGKESG